MNARIALSLTLALLVIACHKKQDDESSRATGTTIRPPAARATQSALDAPESPELDVDVPEDFAQDAKEAITTANVVEELDELEKEIGGSERKP